MRSLPRHPRRRLPRKLPSPRRSPRSLRPRRRLRPRRLPSPPQRRRRQKQSQRPRPSRKKPPSLQRRKRSAKPRGVPATRQEKSRRPPARSGGLFFVAVGLSHPLEGRRQAGDVGMFEGVTEEFPIWNEPHLEREPVPE